MKKIFNKFLAFFLSSGLLAFLFNIGYLGIKEDSDKKTRSLDSLITINYQNVDERDLKEKNFEIRYKGKPINRFSQISVELFNFSDESFKDVPVFVEIIPAEEDSFRSVESEVFGSNNLPEKIIEIKDSLKSTVRGSYKKKYIIKNADITKGSTQPVFTARYLVLGNKKPTVRVDIDQLGLSLQEYKSSHRYKTPLYYRTWFIVLIGIIMYGFIIYLAIRITAYFQEEKNKRFGVYIRKNLNDKISNGQSFNDAEIIVAEYKKINDQFDYDDASKFKRWIKNMKKPL